VHEFLSPLKHRYGQCRWCGKPATHICIKCGYCYLCHPKIEKIEKKRVPANINMSRLTDIENLPLSS